MAEKTIKKTVALHPLMDEYVRITWSIMIENNVPDASYSSALNFMLLGAIFEAQKKRGWTRDTLENVWDFAFDRETIEQLKLQETVPMFKQYIEREENNARRRRHLAR